MQSTGFENGPGLGHWHNQNQTRTRTGAGASLGLGLGSGLGYGRQTVEADGTVDGGLRSDRIKIWAIPTTRQEK